MSISSIKMVHTSDCATVIHVCVFCLRPYLIHFLWQKPMWPVTNTHK